MELLENEVELNENDNQDISGEAETGLESAAQDNVLTITPDMVDEDGNVSIDSSLLESYMTGEEAADTDAGTGDDSNVITITPDMIDEDGNINLDPSMFNIEGMESQAGIPVTYEMPIWSTIGVILIVGVSIVLTTIILMQKKRASGFSSSLGGAGSDTYWSKNKGRSLEGALEKYTKILGWVFIVGVLILNLVM